MVQTVQRRSSALVSQDALSHESSAFSIVYGKKGSDVRPEKLVPLLGLIVEKPNDMKFLNSLFPMEMVDHLLCLKLLRMVCLMMRMGLSRD